MDRLFFPRFKEQPIERPIYIIGSPRSGTTFLHRLMSHDEQFTSTRLIHTILPAVSFYKLIELIGKMDRRIGRPLSRFAGWMVRKGFSGWQGIHRTRLTEPEEDEQYFMYALLSPALTLLFPFFDVMEAPFFVDGQSREVQHKLMAYYRDCLQRHLYARGPNKILLTKNTMLSGRLHTTHDAFPDMRVVHIVRHPYEAIPSLMSMFDASWQHLAPQTRKDPAVYRALASLFLEYYRRRMQIRATWSPGQYVEVLFRDLVADPEGVVTHIYQTLGLSMSHAFRIALHFEAEKARNYQSTHQYSLEKFGLTREFIYKRIPNVFEAYGFER